MEEMRAGSQNKEPRIEFQSSGVSLKYPEKKYKTHSY